MKETKDQSNLENFKARPNVHFMSTCRVLGKRNAKYYLCSFMSLLFFYPLGTNVMCLEGGCVCCVVLVTRCELSTSND